MIINNNPNNNFREIKKIYIFKNDVLNPIYFYDKTTDSQDAISEIETSLICVINNVIPDDFHRSIVTKSINGNIYYEVNISIDLYDLHKDKILEINELFNKKGFGICYETQEEQYVIGNEDEALNINIIDNIKENGRGEDYITIAISGETIYRPIIHTII